MLRDVLAGNVVERARRLAALKDLDDAFTDVTHKWTTQNGWPQSVRQLHPDLVGFEMVVASANNAAVENVSKEIPARKELAQRWRKDSDYFAKIATQTLRDSTKTDRDGSTTVPDAWGLVAARLGSKRNRSAFRSAFWFDVKDPKTSNAPEGSVPRMQTRLKRWRDGTSEHKTWSVARADFLEAQGKVESLIQERLEAQTRLSRMPELATREDTLSRTVSQLDEEAQTIHYELERHEPIERAAEADRDHAQTSKSSSR